MEPQELSLDIPESGAVFVFGKKMPGRFHIKNDSVISAACGEEHALVATSSGRLFAFGKNDSGQLGLGHKEPGVTKPTCVKRLREIGQKAVRVACGPTHSLVTTESGGVYGCGINTDGQLTGQATDYADPVEIQHLVGREIKDLAAGRSFSLVLTKQGEVFAWGSNEEGCLGCGDDVQEARDSLVQVRLPDKAVSLSAGAYHCACVLANGQVFTWGETEGGKLGCPGSEEKATQHLPQQAPLPPDTKAASGTPPKARSVACGLRHTLVLCEAGQVFACGSGESGQLGLGTGCGYTAALMPVLALDGLPVACISAGECHSACVSSEAGYLYTFGDALHGKLGPSSRLGGHSNQHRPFRVTALKPIRARRAICGNVLTLVLAAQRVPGDPAAGADSDEADDPLDSMSARSPRPLRRAEQAALEATGGAGAVNGDSGGGGLLRRRSSKSRQKYREMTRSSGGGLVPPPTVLNGDTFELVRPAMQGAPTVEASLKKPVPSASQFASELTAREEAISMFDQLLEPLDADGVEDGVAAQQEAAKAASEPKIKRQERRLSLAKPIPSDIPEQVADEDDQPPPPPTADQEPVNAPVLIEAAATEESEAPPAEAAAAAIEEELQQPGGASGSQQQPVKGVGCGRRKRQGPEVAAAAVAPAPTSAAPGVEGAEGGQAIAQQPDGQAANPVKGVGCGSRRSRSQKPPQAPLPEAQPAQAEQGTTAVAEETVVASDEKSAESAPVPEADAAQSTPKEDATSGGDSGAVKGVGCGRSRRLKQQPPPPQNIDQKQDGEPVEEAVVASDSKAAEAAPAMQDQPVPDADAPTQTPKEGSSGAVKGVGCGGSRSRRQKQEQQKPNAPISGEEAAATAPAGVEGGEGVEGDVALQPATAEGEADPDGAKKSKSCTLL